MSQRVRFCIKLFRQNIFWTKIFTTYQVLNWKSSCCQILKLIFFQKIRFQTINIFWKSDFKSFTFFKKTDLEAKFACENSRFPWIYTVKTINLSLLVFFQKLWLRGKNFCQKSDFENKFVSRVRFLIKITLTKSVFEIKSQQRVTYWNNLFHKC